MKEEYYIIREQEQIRKDLSTYLKKHEQKEMLRFLVAGSVDDGKSTLIGRLLYDSRLIYQDHLSAIYRDSQTYNTTDHELDLSLLTDGLKAEREQGITIDVAYRYFSTEKRSFIICDSPGHEQYTRNMATGATHCDLVLILVDAQNGIQPQTRRHSLIATLMGIRQIVVLVNKMDLVDYKESRFKQICEEYNSFSKDLAIDSLYFIPISALEGDNVVEQSNRMPWYKGSQLLNYLEETQLVSNRNLTDFRFPVQCVFRPNATFRGYSGSIVSGVIQTGDEVFVMPSGQKTRIRSIETFEGPISEAFAPMPVVLTTEDEVDISRGNMLVKSNNLPYSGNRFEATVVWMDNTQELSAGQAYLLKSNTQTTPCRIQTIQYQYNINKLTQIPSERLSFNGIGQVEIITNHPLLFDSFKRNQATGSFILIDRKTNQTSGGGIILNQNIDSTINFLVNKQAFRPKTIWMTGLSGSGKSTLAESLKIQLENDNIQAFVLDGDELRKGLNNNLGFSPEDRKENVRRVAEVAKLMNDAGLVCIVALISPYKEDREQAKHIIGPGFREVWISTKIDICRERDPKGLYKKVDAGEIKGFTGVDAPYEQPENPDLVIDTVFTTINESVREIIDIIT